MAADSIPADLVQSEIENWAELFSRPYRGLSKSCGFISKNWKRIFYRLEGRSLPIRNQKSFKSIFFPPFDNTREHPAAESCSRLCSAILCSEIIVACGGDCKQGIRRHLIYMESLYSQSVCLAAHSHRECFWFFDGNSGENDSGCHSTPILSESETHPPAHMSPAAGLKVTPRQQCELGNPKLGVRGLTELTAKQTNNLKNLERMFWESTFSLAWEGLNLLWLERRGVDKSTDDRIPMVCRWLLEDLQRPQVSSTIGTLPPPHEGGPSPLLSPRGRPRQTYLTFGQLVWSPRNQLSQSLRLTTCLFCLKFAFLNCAPKFCISTSFCSITSLILHPRSEHTQFYGSFSYFLLKIF